MEEEEGFYLPHHAVLKLASLTTDLRVVYDGSAEDENFLSLNDNLMIGPVIQADIFSLLLRFLTHQYVLTGDIEKMYRQFWIRNEDRKYQKIWWRDVNGKEQIFELNTITFGLSAAPFLAIRCLQQLADDYSQEFPEAARVIKEDIYVDDLQTGTDSFEEAIKLRDDVSELLKKGQLNMRQWASNDPRLLEGLPEGSVNVKLKLSEDSTIKTLGLYWKSNTDEIAYTVLPISTNLKMTKRIMLSEVSKIFDPLGFLGPVIIKGRMILHRLWLEKLDWDDAVPLSIFTDWKKYSTQLTELNNISFDRKIIIAEAEDIQLHGFCDASEKGYGVCIYIRSTNAQGTTQTRLLCSKSRVAPIKTTSLPRLELCSASLLSDLSSTVRKAIKHPINRIIFWSDSMIALHWIKTPPHKLQVFVGNRVSNIQQKTEDGEWKHVRSEDNPADHLSRGLYPNEFTQDINWKNGPNWLSQDESNWPISELTILPETQELRKTQCLITNWKGKSKHEEILESNSSHRIDNETPWILKFSSIGFLRKLFAFGLRFKNKNKGPLSASELLTANERIIKLVQESAFSEEIKELKRKQGLSPNHKWKGFNPFIDDNGIIRVGGRLKNSDIPYSEKHPRLLPKDHHITTLLIRNEHITNCHAGSQTTLYALRKNYWIVNGREQVRKIIKTCVTCVRTDPPKSEYIMGNIPKLRITEAKPFHNVGIDYCGYFYIKEKKHRNKNRIKVWVCVFVCLVVKAVHLEVVTDLSTEGFLGAFKRFIARRGKPKNIYSDNGTNFIGANNEIKELYSFLQSKKHNDTVFQHLSEKGINWHFIPPLSPNFGGLWEAGVKSFKHHLKRICNELVTFEQFNTLIIEIEAILNSRPLTPISTDPNDLIALTPGHFLTGNSLMSLPEPNFEQTAINRLSTWELIQKKQQEFWKRWHKEYINEQNLRSKWNKGSHEIKKDTLVILREDNLPPRQWSLGRIIETYPGSDGIIRVVKVKTTKGEFNRNVRKISPLLCDYSEKKQDV
ncbi:uncharacterized protein LOC122505692 [Leptopilina heterotoma]|uniref:uncharacterized protein LOC122505692 n=1 Tax=Leptopilina heterotoma TaxID=63436 RepID=UPI001CA9DA78|nr:uncharacterized protein LOC122505692 [Leptopilina heterotoma]